MGCDIHAHFEIKVNGKWEHYSNPYIQRNYNMFGWLAKVRIEDNQVIKVKGLPEDISVVTRIDWKRGKEDWHTPSWLDASEISLWIKEFPELDRTSEDNFHPSIGYLFNSGFDYWAEYPQDYPKDIEDLRMVFWFDN